MNIAAVQNIKYSSPINTRITSAVKRSINTEPIGNNALQSAADTQSSDKHEFSFCSFENIKANFSPAFNGYRKVGRAVIIDRETNNPVYADIRKEKIGDYISLKLMAGREEAGFLDMCCKSVFPEKNNVLTLPSNTFPEIQHIRSIMGDKYSGIGTALVKTALQESWNNDGYGNIWLKTEKGYARTYSPYRSNENPIPFYYKLGFESPNKDTNDYIKTCLAKKQYSKLPASTVLILTDKAKKRMTKELCENPIIKFKKEPNLG